jgi:hypothetical protein
MEDENNEGCRVKGHVMVPKTDGNLHFAPAADFHHAAMPWQQVVSYTFEVCGGVMVV